MVLFKATEIVLSTADYDCITSVLLLVDIG